MLKAETLIKQEIDWQQKGAFLLIITAVLICLLIYFNLNLEMTFSWIFGLLVGFIIQRSRICFTAALRDPVLFGMTELARALIISLMITTVGFALLQYFEMVKGLEISGKIISLGWNIPVGGVIFGIGAAISGGCASGTLIRMGEGFKMQWAALIGFILGSVHGAYDARFWYGFFREPINSHLPTIFDWKTGVTLQLFILGVLLWLTYWREKNKFEL